jgi:hypothetical protein
LGNDAALHNELRHRAILITASQCRRNLTPFGQDGDILEAKAGQRVDMAQERPLQEDDQQDR